MVKALIYAEHTDSTEILSSPDTQGIINRLSTLLAGNEGHTFDYSGSSAAAFGISQFVASTYQSLVQRHGDAGLIKDFRMAMTEHKNSIKATFLLLDDYIAAVKVRAATGFTSGLAFDYGAAAYNGGVTRVSRAINALGSGWNKNKSGDIKSLQAEANQKNSAIKSLKAQIKKPTAKNKPALQKQLATANSELVSINDKLTSLQSSSLRSETVVYLQKIYKVISTLNAQSL